MPGLCRHTRPPRPEPERGGVGCRSSSAGDQRAGAGQPSSVPWPGRLSSVSPEEPRTSTASCPASSRPQGQKGKRGWGQATSYPGRRVTGRGESTRATLLRTRWAPREGARALGSVTTARASALGPVRVWLQSRLPEAGSLKEMDSLGPHHLPPSLSPAQPACQSEMKTFKNPRDVLTEASPPHR